MRYLLVTYVRRPAGGIDEQVGFSSGVKSRDLQTCNIIMDFKTEKVVKCVIEGKVIERSFDALNDYYKEVYPTLIDQLEKVQATEPKAAE